MNWMPPPKWNTLAGRVLDAFFIAVHEALPDYEPPLTIFGSAPIQLCLDEAFASADVDIMVLEGGDRLREIANSAGIGRSGMNPGFGVQICPPSLFRATPHYLQRAWIETRHGLKIVIPNLRDVLIGKLHRSRSEEQIGLVPKDRRAFQRVRQLCGDHPTMAELLEDLIACEPYFRPLSDGSLNAFRFNVEDALREIYGHAFDLQRDIMAARDDATRMTEPRRETVAQMIKELRPERE